MLWNDNLDEFCAWCLGTDDPDAFRSALRSVPDDRWEDVERCLGALDQHAPAYVVWTVTGTARDATDANTHAAGEPPIVMTPDHRILYRKLNFLIGERVRRRRMAVAR